MGRLTLVRQKQQIKLHRALASMGEGTVYPVVDTSLVYKKFHKVSEQRTRKLVAMIRKPPKNLVYCDRCVQIAWPQDLVRDANGRFPGYVMPFVPHSATLYSFIHSGIRLQEFEKIATYKNLVNVARNLSGLIHRVHKTGRFIVGDWNPSNFHVDLDRGLVSALDTDSWQVKTSKEIFLCKVFFPDYSPPELLKPGALKKPRTKYHDVFGLALLVFHMLMDSHPYHGIYNGNGLPPTIPKRIHNNYLPYSRYGTSLPQSGTWFQRFLGTTATLRTFTPPPAAYPLETLNEELRELFFQAFFYGHSDPRARPSAGELFNALDCFQRELVTCEENSHHVFWEGLDECPWCQYRDEHHFDPFPQEK